MNLAHLEHIDRSYAVLMQEKLIQLEQARQLYDSALKRAGNNPTLIGQAKFGIALCLEEKGQFDEAENMYRDLSLNEAYKGTTIVEQAKHRLFAIDVLKPKISFKASEQTTPADTAVPVIKIRQDADVIQNE